MTSPNAALMFAISGATMATSNDISLFVRQAICNDTSSYIQPLHAPIIICKSLNSCTIAW